MQNLPERRSQPRQKSRNSRRKEVRIFCFGIRICRKQRPQWFLLIIHTLTFSFNYALFFRYMSTSDRKIEDIVIGNIFTSVCQEFCPRGGGVRSRGGMHGRGACVAGKTAIEAGGTHPTGMHSCL